MFILDNRHLNLNRKSNKGGTAMKGTASNIETGQFGEFAGAVVSQLWNVVKDKEPKELQRYIENTNALKDVLIKAFGENGKPQLPFNISGTYPVSVDYSLSVKQVVKLGKYDWVNSDINDKNYKTGKKGKAEVAVELIHFNRPISSEDALKKIDQNGYRPAELHELLTLGEKHPNLQREFFIVALGSVWQDPNGNRSVPCLYRNASKRNLYLFWLGSDWADGWRFAVVRK